MHIKQREKEKIVKFKLSKTFIESYRDKRPDWGNIGEITYKRSYANKLPDGRTEEWYETCERVVNGIYELQRQHIVEHLNAVWDTTKAQKSSQEMFKYMFDMKFLPPGRGLDKMGSDFVMNDGGGASCFNCAFCSTMNIDENFSAPFVFLLEVGMYGVGPGFDTRGAGKIKLQKPKVGGTFVVEDSREGWSALLKCVLDSYVGIGNFPETIDYSQIRAFGTPLKRFGGTASGPQALQDLVENIKRTLDTPNSRITSSQIVDLANYIGIAVVAGGSRRIAEIAFGDPDDKEFINLKDDYEKVKSHRWASNNSVFATIGMDYEELAKHSAKTGEPGYMWLDNARNFSRMGSHAPDYKDTLVDGGNPCSEQSLENMELCCLVETFPARCENKAEFLRVLKFAYLYGKTTTLLKTPWQRTNQIMLKNRRIGLSQCGVLDNIARVGFREHMRWSDEGYQIIQKWDQIYSDWFCIPRSKKTTSIKPAGTVSLLPGSRPGIHDTPAKSQYYIRRVELLKNSPFIQPILNAGYIIVPSMYKKESVVVEFPIKENNYTPFPLSIWPQLEIAAQMQEHWADNQVSITVYVPENEKDQIALALSMYETRLKAVSFFPYRNDYEQPPYEPITEKEYKERTKNLKVLDLTNVQHEYDDKFCDSDTCELREI